jgi:hypothetical protein
MSSFFSSYIEEENKHIKVASPWNLPRVVWTFVLADKFGGGFFLGEGWVLHVFQLHHIKIIVVLEVLQK